MAQKIIVVKAAYDAEVRVWYVESSDLPGLNAEAEFLEALLDKLPAAIEDLLDEGGFDEAEDGPRGEVPVELIAHLSTRARFANT